MGGSNDAAFTVMTESASVTQKIEKVMCEKVVKSFVKGASVGRAGNGAEQARSTDQEPAVQVVPVQKRLVCGEGQRERWLRHAHVKQWMLVV